MDFLTMMSLVIKYGPIVGHILSTAGSNESIVQKIEDLAPDVTSVLKDIGARFFPQAAQDIQVVAGAVTIDPAYVKTLQGDLNLLTNAGLVVDGIYGKATQAAVTSFQQTHNLDVDGVAGKLTQAAIQDAKDAIARAAIQGAKTAMTEAENQA
jgi:murein L,D-transpeptidase YcbB/YkuD